MVAVRKAAEELRLQGFSYNEINAVLGVPKSTLSSWFSQLALSKEAQERLSARVAQGTLNGLIRRNKLQTQIAQKRRDAIRIKAWDEVSQYIHDPLWLAGVLLYWAEGYKRTVVKDGQERTWHMIGFTNADPDMIRIFILFLTHSLQVSKDDISVNVRLFDRANEAKALSHWRSVTGLQSTHFNKVSYAISRSSAGKRPYNQLPFGTVQVRVCSTEKFHRLMGWIEGVTSILAPNGKHLLG